MQDKEQNASLVDVSAATGSDRAFASDTSGKPDNGFSQTRIVMILGLLVSLGIVFGAYHSTLGCGFLLDDFKHITTAYQAWHGKTAELTGMLFGQWGGQTDGLSAYRPLVSSSFLVDSIFYGVNPWGYHLTNLLVFAGCVFLCGVMAYQLTDAPRVQRLQAGFAALVLFASYPIHAESVSWIIGRVDVHCTFFYLASLCLYFQFRKAGTRAYLISSSVAFLFALCSKEMAVTLPMVLVGAELLIARPLNWQQTSVRARAACIGIFLLTFAGFGVVRTLLLGALVGGYGSTSLKGIIEAVRLNFLNQETFFKILFGVNEEQPFPPKVAKMAMYAWNAILFSLIVRLFEPLARIRVFLFLTMWAVLSILPTFQIWHIFPNLVGSRLFFLGSAPLAVMLAVVLIPAFKPAYFSTGVNGIIYIMRILRVVGVVALAVLALGWFRALDHNIYPWVEAGRQMNDLRGKLETSARSTPDGESIVLVDVPQDFSGAGMIGRPEFVTMMFSKPLCQTDLSGKFVTLVRPVPGPTEYIYPNLLATISSDRLASQCLHFSKDDKGFITWQKPQGAAWLSVSVKSDKELKEPTAPLCEWIAEENDLDPIAVSCLTLNVDSSIPLEELAHKAQLVWRSEHQPKSWIDYSEGPFAEVHDGKLLFIPARYRSWVLNGKVKDIGIKFYPGTYTVKPRMLTDVPAANLIPSIGLMVQRARGQNNQSLEEVILPRVSPADGILITYNVSMIKSASAALLVVTEKDKACPDLPTTALPPDSEILLKRRLDNVRGELALPLETVIFPGKHQVAVIALDSKGDPVGYISEPRTYFVETGKR